MYNQLKLDNQLCFRLYTASRLITQAYRPLLEPLGLTYPQYLVLMVLWENDHQLVSDISKRLVLESNTITPLLQRMESEGLIVRTKGTADKRQTLVNLSRKGIALQEQAKDIPDCMTAAFSDCAPSQEESRVLVQTLDSIIKYLKNSD